MEMEVESEFDNRDADSRDNVVDDDTCSLEVTPFWLLTS